MRYTAAAGVEKLRPVTASDVVYAVRRSCDPRTASDYAYVDYVIAGCMELNTADPGTLTEESLLDARAHNFLTALFREPQREGAEPRLALASIDISTGELIAAGDISGADLRMARS